MLMQDSVTTIVDGYTVHCEGWELIFYLFGLSGLIWCPFYIIRVYEFPALHPSISPHELALIKDGTYVS